MESNAVDATIAATDPAFLTLIKKMFYAVAPHAAVIICCAIVMAMTHPKSFREGFVALLATFACAIYGPSVIIAIFHIDLTAVSVIDQDKARSMLTIVCGMPGWVIVRACFNWSEINKNRSIIDLAKQIKDVWK